MNCPSCGAPMRLAAGSDYMQCDFCRNIHIADPDDEGVRLTEEPSALACPVCGEPLWNATLGGVRLQSCRKCRGMLVPMGTFVDLIEQLRSRQGEAVATPKRAASEELRRTINCPQCHRPMDAHFYLGGGSVVMDACDPCCVNWLDHGELMRIVRAPD